jgi:hypothetical protein
MSPHEPIVGSSPGRLVEWTCTDHRPSSLGQRMTRKCRSAIALVDTGSEMAPCTRSRAATIGAPCHSLGRVEENRVSSCRSEIEMTAADAVSCRRSVLACAITSIVAVTNSTTAIPPSRSVVRARMGRRDASDEVSC